MSLAFIQTVPALAANTWALQDAPTAVTADHMIAIPADATHSTPAGAAGLSSEVGMGQWP